MANAGTMLDELGQGAPAGDGDLVQEIFRTMNEPSQANPIYNNTAPPPPVGVRAPMMNAQEPMPSTLPNSADPTVPTAHMIGRDHPTSADFQAMVNSGPVAFNMAGPGGNYQSAHAMEPFQPTMQEQGPPKKNWQGQFIDELKLPVLVALVVGIVTLPALNLLVAHYAPKLMLPTGEFTWLGLILRAVIAGALFWFFQTVVGPLVAF